MTLHCRHLLRCLGRPAAVGHGTGVIFLIRAEHVRIVFFFFSSSRRQWLLDHFSHGWRRPHKGEKCRPAEEEKMPLLLLAAAV